MKRHLFILLALAMSAASVCAQSPFDDKWFDKPVRYRVDYDNDQFRIQKIVRNNYWTVFEIMHDDPYRAAGGWMYMEYNMKLVDQDTKKEYYLVNSTGIPKQPDRYNFTTEGPVKKVITLYFPPLPESVKKVTLVGRGMSCYDVDIAKVKPQIKEGFRTVEAPAHVSKNKGLRLDRVMTDGEFTLLYLTYTAPNTTSVNLSMGTSLVDPATKKTYKLLKYGGIPKSPEKLYMEKGNSLSFFLVFQPLPATVKKVNMIESSNGWQINGIVLP